MSLLLDGVKGEIIGVLMEKHPLTVHEIQEDILSRYKHDVSKQGIHRAINDLLERGFITREDRSYQIDLRFIETLDRIVGKLKSSYYNVSSSTYLVPRGKSKRFKSNTLLEHDLLWNKIITEIMFSIEPKKNNYYQHVPHAWFAISNFEAEIKVTSLISERCKGFYTLVNGNTELDKWIGRFYTTPSSYYTVREISDPKERDRQYAVLGDYILECQYPREIADRLQKIFSSVGSLSEISLQELIATVNLEVELELVLHNNPRKADSYRYQIGDCFS